MKLSSFHVNKYQNSYAVYMCSPISLGGAIGNETAVRGNGEDDGLVMDSRCERKTIWLYAGHLTGHLVYNYGTLRFLAWIIGPFYKYTISTVL